MSSLQPITCFGGSPADPPGPATAPPGHAGHTPSSEECGEGMTHPGQPQGSPRFSGCGRGSRGEGQSGPHPSSLTLLTFFLLHLPTYIIDLTGLSHLLPDPLTSHRNASSLEQEFLYILGNNSVWIIAGTQ